MLIIPTLVAPADRGAAGYEIADRGDPDQDEPDWGEADHGHPARKPGRDARPYQPLPRTSRRTSPERVSAPEQNADSTGAGRRGLRPGRHHDAGSGRVDLAPRPEPATNADNGVSEGWKNNESYTATKV